ncbi:hypothetical protein K466DRAFT_667852 [Polyporus arcularius HHB13444]|uniref:Uncharacterized protein n=1 Tax=Polyporus arcularius HHB13444 TaxID=1314778 RepID=A0A5C3NTH5_9APHY|nr:hypothetical protein K466DRAFT_667852 [Polyporus arcularius HHB13444]
MHPRMTITSPDPRLSIALAQLELDQVCWRIDQALRAYPGEANELTQNRWSHGLGREMWTVVNAIGLANTAAWTSPNMSSSDPPSSRNRSRSYCSIANGTETPFGYRWSDSIFRPYFKVCPNTAAGLTRSPVRSAGASGRGHEETLGRAKIQ